MVSMVARCKYRESVTAMSAAKYSDVRLLSLLILTINFLFDIKKLSLEMPQKVSMLFKES